MGFYIKCVSSKKISGNEAYYTISSKLLVNIMLCSKRHDHKSFKLRHIPYKIGWGRSRGRVLRVPPPPFRPQNPNGALLEHAAVVLIARLMWYTLHSTLYTRHSTLYTRHSTLHTLHSTLTLYTLYPYPRPPSAPHYCHMTLLPRAGQAQPRLRGLSPAHRYRGTSLIRNNSTLGPYSRTMPRALGGRDQVSRKRSGDVIGCPT